MGVGRAKAKKVAMKVWNSSITFTGKLYKYSKKRTDKHEGVDFGLTDIFKGPFLIMPFYDTFTILL